MINVEKNVVMDILLSIEQKLDGLALRLDEIEEYLNDLSELVNVYGLAEGPNIEYDVYFPDGRPDEDF